MTQYPEKLFQALQIRDPKTRRLFMAKRFTPIIGLAVVVALAMVAVFGAMSLTNPAFAAVGAPADAELAERTSQPQTTLPRLELMSGTTEGFDITSYITGGRSAVDDAVDASHTAGADKAAVISVAELDVNATNVELNLRAENVVGRARVTVMIAKSSGTNPQVIIFDVRVVAVPESTVPTAVGEMPDVRVGAGLKDAAEPSNNKAGTAIRLDASEYFEDGTGPDGGITGYVITISDPSTTGANPIDLRVSAEAAADNNEMEKNSSNGVFWLRASMTGGTVGASATITVVAQSEVDPSTETQVFYVDVVDTDSGPSQPTEDAVFEADSNTPGKVTRYEFTLPLEEETNTLIHDMVIELEDFGFPSSIRTSSVAVTTNSGTSDTKMHFTFTPEDVAISGEKLLLSMGDITEDTAGASDEQTGIYLLGGKDNVITLVIRTTAGISNPTESNSYEAQVEFGDNDFTDVVGIFVPRVVGLDEEDGGRGDEITVTGKGYKNGTSVTFWRDEMTQVMWDDDNDMSNDMVRLMPMYKEDYETAVKADPARGSHMYPLPETENTEQWNHDGNNRTPPLEVLVAPNGSKDPNEERLCSAVADGQDVASCEFEVTNPPFVGGDVSNYVNGVDGRGNIAHKDGDDDQRFLLLPSISATPNGGSPGEVMLVQLADFPPGVGVDKVQLSRRDICGGFAVTASGNAITCQGSTDGSGNVNISVVIPNWAEPGKQELKVFTANAGDDSITVDISGPIITPTPRSVVANQRVSLVGSGFFAGAKIGDCDDCGNAAITIGGDQIAWPRINGNDDVNVDNGGNWSAAVDLPLTSATTAAGKRTIRVTDSKGRTGTVDITIPGREVSITPTIGRVGTEAVIRGSNFPSKNDDGDSFNVVIIYDAGNGKQATVTAVPDASGRFETPLRIPTTAGIPSTNTVKVEFDDSNDVKVVTTVTHEVPEGAIRLSADSGSSGSKVTISGEGFKAFVPVQSVKVGNIEVTPSPNPSTDGQGMLSFNVKIPGLDNGIQTIEVRVSGTTASVGFTVRPSGVSAGDITASAEAIVNLGENFVRSFNFNNDTKSWTFYSPEAPDDSTQTNFITGESYWILIGESQEVILNGKTRNLTCGAGNCWNQIVW
jgi:hypothetical protein